MLIAGLMPVAANDAYGPAQGPSLSFLPNGAIRKKLVARESRFGFRVQALACSGSPAARCARLPL